MDYRLVDNAPDGIAVFPPDDRVLAYVNPSLAKLLGETGPTALVGTRIDLRVHPDDRALFEKRRELLLSTHAAQPPQEYRLLRKDSSTVFAEVVSIIIEYDERPHVLAFLRDLSERKLMQARLRLADRMAAVGTLAAGVAHEINNPLAYVMANLEVVETRRLPRVIERLRALGGEAAALAEAVEEATALLGIARGGAERVRDIVRDLRTFTRGDDDERLGPVDVRRVLDASIQMAFNEIRHRAHLVREYDDVPPALANEARLGQVFLNLVVNAAQALPVGSAAENTIRARATTDDAGRIVVEVSDSGSGIDSRALAHIFDPFFTTKPSGVGTGLGLWICQGIVSALGGRIEATSEPGRGATFRVTLLPAEPVAARPAPAGRVAAR